MTNSFEQIIFGLYKTIISNLISYNKQIITQQKKYLKTIDFI